MITNYSGLTEFARDDNSFLLPVTELEPADGEGRWAKLDVDALRRLLRQVHSDPERASAIGRRAREHIVTTYALVR